MGRKSARARSRRGLRRSADQWTRPDIHVDYMFVGDEKEARWRMWSRAKERTTRSMFGTVVPRKSPGQSICVRLPEFGVEVRELRREVKQNEWWSNVRAMKGGSRMIVETSPVVSSKSDGTFEKPNQSVQGRIRTTRSSSEKLWELRRGHQLARDRRACRTLVVEIRGREDGKLAYERSKSGKVQGMMLAERIWCIFFGHVCKNERTRRVCTMYVPLTVICCTTRKLNIH